ncbi:hypothetical protein JKP88DRAFT_250483 [Tribonema minus]|uniref:Uncharacterized protein n=1 Tax=Tribonema minus TaxID=303371 RepID=A0A836C859_9STRA|nr:hypothetical protein JKP88DRAFT_250483 [Tribonema minus]
MAAIAKLLPIAARSYNLQITRQRPDVTSNHIVWPTIGPATLTAAFPHRRSSQSPHAAALHSPDVHKWSQRESLRIHQPPKNHGPEPEPGTAEYASTHAELLRASAEMFCNIPLCLLTPTERQVAARLEEKHSWPNVEPAVLIKNANDAIFKKEIAGVDAADDQLYSLVRQQELGHFVSDAAIEQAEEDKVESVKVASWNIFVDTNSRQPSSGRLFRVGSALLITGHGRHSRTGKSDLRREVMARARALGLIVTTYRENKGIVAVGTREFMRAVDRVQAAREQEERDRAAAAAAPPPGRGGGSKRGRSSSGGGGGGGGAERVQRARGADCSDRERAHSDSRDRARCRDAARGDRLHARTPERPGARDDRSCDPAHGRPMHSSHDRHACGLPDERATTAAAVAAAVAAAAAARAWQREPSAHVERRHSDPFAAYPERGDRAGHGRYAQRAPQAEEAHERGRSAAAFSERAPYAEPWEQARRADRSQRAPHVTVGDKQRAPLSETRHDDGAPPFKTRYKVPEAAATEAKPHAHYADFNAHFKQDFNRDLNTDFNTYFNTDLKTDFNTRAPFAQTGEHAFHHSASPPPAAQHGRAHGRLEHAARAEGRSHRDAAVDAADDPYSPAAALSIGYDSHAARYDVPSSSRHAAQAAQAAAAVAAAAAARRLLLRDGASHTYSSDDYFYASPHRTGYTDHPWSPHAAAARSWGSASHGAGARRRSPSPDQPRKRSRRE